MGYQVERDAFAQRAEFAHRYSIIDIPCETILPILLTNSEHLTARTNCSDYSLRGHLLPIIVGSQHLTNPLGLAIIGSPEYLVFEPYLLNSKLKKRDIG